MTPAAVLVTVIAYFLVLYLVASLSGRRADNQGFFVGNRRSPWPVVAFAMIGSSISGVTFVSVPGWVQASQFSYLQMALGFVAGQLVIAFVLIPLFYRMGLVSIYQYLESRFGIAASSTWSACTTAASNGSVNSMHDSYTPLGGFVQMLQMALGEVVFGGVGCGLYGMIGFAILTVFIAGLMVGRTPEFLGKKIEPGEMRWAVVLCLATPFAILVCSAIACMVPGLVDQLNNGGAHGFSEVLYAFTSCGGNNGSAFAGMNCNIPWINVMLGLEMLFARFMPIIGTLAIAGSLAKKGKVAESAGTLSTTNGMFVFLLVFIVLLIGALSFFPALALGPVAEFFQMIA